MNTPTLLALFDRLLDEKTLELRNEIELDFAIRSKRGAKGSPGRDFNFEENKEGISKLILNYIEDIKNDLKLKFKDLSVNDIEKIKLKFSDLSIEDRKMIQGPRGKPGRNGVSFVYDDHIDDINKAILKVFNLNSEEFNNSIKSIFLENKDTLKLKFCDLSEDELELLKGSRGEKGPRGQKGPKGFQGEKGYKGDKGDNGIQGKTGSIGPRGVPGLPGVKGETGFNGFNAPVVVDISINKLPKNYISFTFKYSDGSEIETDSVELPKVLNYLISQSVGGGGGGNGGSGTEFFEAFFQGITVGDYNAVDFLSNYFVVSITGNKLEIDLDLTDLETRISDLESNVPGCIDVFDEGNVATGCLRTVQFTGNLVTVTNKTVMSDWVSLADVVPSLSGYEAVNPGFIEVNIDSPGGNSGVDYRRVIDDLIINVEVDTIRQFYSPLFDGEIFIDGEVFLL